MLSVKFIYYFEANICMYKHNNMYVIKIQYKSDYVSNSERNICYVSLRQEYLNVPLRN